MLQLGAPRALPNWPDSFESRFVERFRTVMADDEFIMSVIRFHEMSVRNPTHIQILKHAVGLASGMAFTGELLRLG